jgi:hypothetical protein
MNSSATRAVPYRSSKNLQVDTCGMTRTLDSANFQSLDERYLEFRDKTLSVFAQYPQIEPLRYVIFKELLVKRCGFGPKQLMKHWGRVVSRRARKTAGLQQADVLIWVESGREVVTDALLPVNNELLKRGIKVQLVSRADADNLPGSTLRFRHADKAVRPNWSRTAWDALIAAVPSLQDHSLELSFAYSCATIQGLFDELLRVVNAIRPKLVVDASNGLIGGAALLVTCRSLGIRSLLMQHGISQVFSTPLLADYMLTWGQSSNDTLISLDVPAEQLIALGSPRHDSTPTENDGRARSALLGALSLPDRPTFVFFSNGNDFFRNANAPIECARWLEEIASQYSNRINVVVRLHPNEDGSLYKTCPNLQVTKDVPDLTTTLQGCDWSGSLCSTVLYEALLYEKPVWQFYADGWPDLADNWKHGLATRIASQFELSEMIRRILDDRGEALGEACNYDRVFANRGCATEAVGDFIESQLHLA